MSDLFWSKLFGMIPALAWVAFAVFVYLTLRRPVLRDLLPRLSGVKGLGVELTLAAELLDKASDGGEQMAPPVTASERRGVLRRVRLVGVPTI